MNYEGFAYPATELRRFLLTAGIFTIILKNGDIVHHTPDQPEDFLEWLKSHNITDMRSS